MNAEKHHGPERGRKPPGVGSETRRQLQEMRPGEAWSHEQAARDYRAGGNEGEFAETAGKGAAQDGGAR
ncbi:hypothetical protein J2Z79_001464 [Symbiobacterium terraclitae]|uniref:Uncharacterized protein n=1 Tax=Symbiobacterium terraclitae TaxID=557451 RepID=A0ABS4JRA6_9FIRM|nr:hypothetical protein [Symbiobacterium terraclitae]MBP2018065.1 hypothetical protein [Symbiobacterium terraclitae]